MEMAFMDQPSIMALAERLMAAIFLEVFIHSICVIVLGTMPSTDV
jgi:aspartyl-tRNA synthetase